MSITTKTVVVAVANKAVSVTVVENRTIWGYINYRVLYAGREIGKMVSYWPHLPVSMYMGGQQFANAKSLEHGFARICRRMITPLIAAGL